MRKRSVVAWWGIPCKSMIPVFRSLHETRKREVRFVSLQDLPERRRRLGWQVPPTGEMPFQILPDDSWQQDIQRLVESSEGLHIVNGLYHNPRVRYLLKMLLANNRSFGVIMEAPSNLEVGLRRRAKSIALRLVTPLRTRRAARRSEFVLSASGDRAEDFVRLGFEVDRIFPFGYFPDYPAIDGQFRSSGDVRLLCVGYLEPFKGQDCLLRAIAILRDRGTSVRCTITGFGSARHGLLELRDRLGLDEAVDFPGVVSDEELARLFGASTLMIAPGLEEPWGIRVNEALLAGLPVVVSDGVGAHEIVQSTGGGEVFRAGDASSLADATDRALLRLGPEGDLQSRLDGSRDCIRPAAAADYLELVISRGESRSAAAEPVPRPAWLAIVPHGHRS